MCPGQQPGLIRVLAERGCELAVDGGVLPCSHSVLGDGERRERLDCLVRRPAHAKPIRHRCEVVTSPRGVIGHAAHEATPDEAVERCVLGQVVRRGELGDRRCSFRASARQEQADRQHRQRVGHGGWRPIGIQRPSRPERRLGSVSPPHVHMGKLRSDLFSEWMVTPHVAFGIGDGEVVLGLVVPPGDHREASQDEPAPCGRHLSLDLVDHRSGVVHRAPEQHEFGGHQEPEISLGPIRGQPARRQQRVGSGIPAAVAGDLDAEDQEVRSELRVDAAGRGDTMAQRRCLVGDQGGGSLVELCPSRRAKGVIRGRLNERMREGDGAVRGGPALLEEMGGDGPLQRPQRLRKLREAAGLGETAGEPEDRRGSHQPSRLRSARLKSRAYQRAEVGRRWQWQLRRLTQHRRGDLIEDGRGVQRAATGVCSNAVGGTGRELVDAHQRPEVADRRGVEAAHSYPSAVAVLHQAVETREMTPWRAAPGDHDGEDAVCLQSAEREDDRLE
jgi:hypothetical protein